MIPNTSCENVDTVMPTVSPNYTVGTLIYSKAGLISLFGWLLWGDFMYNLMEIVLPSFMPLLLKDNGATNKQIAFIVSGIWLIANMMVNPIVSYRSDRLRSKWGRRRPFIIFSTPFMVIFLSLIPFAPEILKLLSRSATITSLMEYSPIAPLILMFGCLVAAFQIFNIFIQSIYFYLIPDVVPKPLLGRFYSLFRIVGTLASLMFNYFLFGPASTHLRELFVGAALLYGVVITMMCWRVKEGEYPPPIQEENNHWWSGIRNYAKECFGSKNNWWVFLAYSCYPWVAIVNPFIVLFYRDELGFTLGSYGKLMALSNLSTALLVYPAGLLLDRWSSHKMLIFCQVISAISCGLAFFTIQGMWSACFWRIFYVSSFIVTGIVVVRWTVDVYPRERYGQFSSAGALFSSITALLLSLAFGFLMDWLKNYRFFLLWVMVVSLIGAVLALIVYRNQRAGSGEKNAPL